jgi:hypothetical protein
MVLALGIFGVVFAALCIWLSVRIFNRRERWAKRTLAAVVGLPVLYVASFGPACWFTSRTHIGIFTLPTVYRPILSVMSDRSNVTKLLRWYSESGAQEGWNWIDISDSASPNCVSLGP